MTSLMERFEHWTRMINANPDGFRKSSTSRKRRLAKRGAVAVIASPYEKMAAEFYGEPIEPDVSERGQRKRALRAVTVEKIQRMQKLERDIREMSHEQVVALASRIKQEANHAGH